MICQARKRGFNGFRFCGKRATYRFDTQKEDAEVKSALRCAECAQPLIDRGEQFVELK